jgi:hypothetical protein
MLAFQPGALCSDWQVIGFLYILCAPVGWCWFSVVVSQAM